MITIDLGNEMQFSFKNSVEEITVKEFQQIINIDKKITGFEYYLLVFNILGADSTKLEMLDFESLIEIVKDFNDTFKMETTEFKRVIVLDGVTYESYEEGSELKLTMKQVVDIERYLKSNAKDWVSYLMSVIYTKSGNNAIKFGSVTLDVALPYIYNYTEKYIKNVQLLNGME